MKKHIFLIMVFSCALALLCGWAGAESPWPESEHPYAENTDETWEYQYPGDAAGLCVLFSEETETEKKYDTITITDSEGTEWIYTGTELSGKAVYLPGTSFTIRLTSDSSVQEYGFSITQIRGLTPEEYEEEQNLVRGTCGENAVWAVDVRDGTLTISGTGPMAEYATSEDGEYWTLTSPPYWDWDTSSDTEESRSKIRHIVVEEGVTTLGGGAFRDLDGLEDISIASTVVSIGGWAFDNTTAIREIRLPDGLTAIEDSTFSGCGSLETVYIPDSVETIGGDAFAYSGITHLSLPSGLVSIGSWAFYATPLTEITIPASVTSIGDRAFYECTSLQNVFAADGSTSFKSVDGILFSADGTEMVCYCPGREDTAYRIPDGVQTIRPSSFSYTSSLEEVELPDSLVSIQNWAFGHTGLKKVLLPKALERLEYCVFGACEDLTSVSLPVSLTEIGEAAFSGCPLEEVLYEGTEEQWDAVEIADDNDPLFTARIYYGAHPYCPHTSMTYLAEKPHTCTEDGYAAHWVCELCGDRFLNRQATRRAGDITIPAAHSYQSSVTLPPTCAEAGIRTYTCTVCTPSTEGHAYSEEIPATGAHRYVAGRCVNILHDGVTECGKLQPGVAAYGKCGYTGGAIDSMISIVLYPGQTLNFDNLCTDAVLWFLDTDGTLTVSGRGAMCTCIQVLRGSNVGGTPTFWGISSPWYQYRSQITRVVIDEGVTGIGLRCFYNCSSIVTLELPSTLERIAADAFYNTGSLRHVYYAGSEQEWNDDVGYSGFGSSVAMHFGAENPVVPDLVLPAGTTVIGSEAFAGMGARVILVPETVQEIADDAFDTGVTLIVAAGSPAEAWAREHLVRFIPR